MICADKKVFHSLLYKLPFFLAIMWEWVGVDILLVTRRSSNDCRTCSSNLRPYLRIRQLLATTKATKERPRQSTFFANRILCKSALDAEYCLFSITMNEFSVLSEIWYSASQNFDHFFIDVLNNYRVLCFAVNFRNFSNARLFFFLVFDLARLKWSNG